MKMKGSKRNEYIKYILVGSTIWERWTLMIQQTHTRTHTHTHTHHKAMLSTTKRFLLPMYFIISSSDDFTLCAYCYLTNDKHSMAENFFFSMRPLLRMKNAQKKKIKCWMLTSENNSLPNRFFFYTEMKEMSSTFTVKFIQNKLRQEKLIILIN